MPSVSNGLVSAKARSSVTQAAEYSREEPFMATEHVQDPTSSSEPTPERTMNRPPRFMKLAWWMVLLLAVVMVCITGFQHSSQVRQLRATAVNVNAGDTRENVLSSLGPPPAQYISEFAPQDGPGSVTGVAYGGSLNLLRSMLDHGVYRALNGYPDWYNKHIAQHIEDWPVVIEFDGSGTVTTVKR